MRQILLALAVGFGGCAGADAMALAPAQTGNTSQLALGLYPGESMAFEVHLEGILVGEAQLAVGEVGMVGGKPAIVVRSRAATAGAGAWFHKISDEATTVIEAESGRPLSVETVVENKGKRITTSATFAGSIAKIMYRIDNSPERKFQVDFGANALHDAHTAMAQVRGWKATPGTRRTVFVVGGRRLWRVDVKYIGEETIGSATGNRRAVVFEGTSYRTRRDLKVQKNKPARTFRVWLSDDADRVPLRVAAKTELGDVKMELLEYFRP